MELKRQQKNSYIELERFLACLGILFYHVGVMKTGWIFVEFFFLLTGYFTIRHFEALRKTEQSPDIWYPLSYTFKKFKSVFPYTTIGILLIWTIDIFRWHLTGTSFLKWLLFLPTNLLLLSGFGVQTGGFEIQEGFYSPNMLNPHLWYICCMLTVMLLVTFLFMYMKKSRVLICFFAPLICYGMIIMADGTLDGWHESFLGIFACDLRALGGILLGALSWYATVWLRKKKWNNGIKMLLTFVEVFCFIFVFVLSWISGMSFDMLKVLLLFSSITLSMSSQTYTARWDWGLFRFLGKLSLPVYCIQYGVIQTLEGRIPYHHTIIVSLITIVIGVLCLLAVETGKKLLKRRFI